jgi:hypothetical protein
MESFIKKVKKRNRKAGGEDQPAQETENHPSLDYNSSFRGEEELVCRLRAGVAAKNVGRRRRIIQRL